MNCFVQHFLLASICCLIPTAALAELITGAAGGDQPHNEMQPSLAVHHIIALQGVFPDRTGFDDDTLIGEVSLFAGNFAPSGWALADGQLLPIAQNTALFSILGTTYGGDGRTTFALPDLRGRAVIEKGNGPGLTSRTIGQRLGSERVELSSPEIPMHDHTVPFSPEPTSPVGNDQGHDNMQPSLVLSYNIALQGIFPSRDGGGSNGPTFLGEVRRFAGNFAPGGRAELDGQLLPIAQNAALFSLLGTTYGGDGRTTFALPDLRGRTPLHQGAGPGLSERRLGARLGEETVLLTETEMPQHSHTLPPTSDVTGNSGGSQPHNNMQPSLGLNYIIAQTGSFPSRDGGLSENFIGEISLFAGNFAPAGWALADGQLLSIAENTALFSILGTTYGGDGRTTFALPDLRGLTAIHTGQGPGLSDRSLGQRLGTEDEFLSLNQLPSHTHMYVPEPTGWSLAILALAGLVAFICCRS